MNFDYVSGDEREALYNEVWTEPMITVAKRYGMSDNGLRKHCRRLGIPLPPNGYWAKLKAGKNVSKTPLPEVYGILKRYVHNYVIKFKTDIKNLNDDELVTDKDLNLLSDETINFINEKCSKVIVKSQLRNPHQLIIEHKEEIKYRKKRDKELKKYVNSIYYANAKSKYRENNPILPLYVSDFNINRTYRIMDALINILDSIEGRIYIRAEGNKDIGEFILMNTIFYFEIKEEIKRNKTNKDDIKEKSILVISFRAQGYYNSKLLEEFQYKDDSNEPLELQLGKIIYKMFVIANKFRAIEELGDRKQEREWEEHKRQRYLEQMREGELEEVKLLEQAVSDWDKARKIRMFIESMENALVDISDVVKKEKVVEWIGWARNKADWLDPLIAKQDELLGKNKQIFDKIIEDDT